VGKESLSFFVEEVNTSDVVSLFSFFFSCFTLSFGSSIPNEEDNERGSHSFLVAKLGNEKLFAFVSVMFLFLASCFVEKLKVGVEFVFFSSF
jgi:hypothetical protein